jgi:hypothetical protein
MALDPSIALGVRPIELPNQLAQYAQMQQIQGYQQANELNQLKMQEAQAANEERNALRQLNPANTDYENQLFKVNPTLGIQYRKERTAAEAQAATAAGQKVTAAETKQKMLNQAWRDISGRPSDANIIAHLEDIQASPLYDAQEKTAIQSRAQAILAIPLAERKSYLEKIGSTGSDYASRATNAATVGATIRGQNLTDAREQQRIAMERDRIKNAENTSVVSKQVVGEDGTVTNFNKFGEVVSTVKGAGKQSATFAKTEAQKKTLAADQKLVMSELADAVKEGGLIDQSTGSGAGRLYDVGAGFFGKATEGDIAIGRLQPIADIVLKTVPRFEGPQSDKDTASYKEAAGNLANANLPREKRKAAANEIIRLMKARQGQFITSDMASGNTAVPSGVAPPEGFVPD